MTNFFPMFTAPALTFSLALLSGLLFSQGIWQALFPALLLLATLSWKKRGLFLLLSALFWWWCSTSYLFLQEECTGEATFTLSSFSRVKKGWVYRGELITLKREGEVVAKKIPCTLFSHERVDPNWVYTASIFALPQGHQARLQAHGKWEKKKPHFTLASLRYKAKKGCKAYLERVFEKKETATFFYTLMTSEKEDKILKWMFAKLGLAHLLAISGFHFALLATFLHFFLKKLFPHKLSSLFLALSLTLFFLFVGAIGSVERAFIMALFFLVGQLFDKRSNSLNNVGIALLIILLTQPLLLFEVGTQLSFIATLAILLITPIVERPLRTLPPWLRKTIALNLAVHLALLPYLLFLFHSFPLHSLLYNLFFPTLVTLSLFLFLLAAPLHLLWTKGGLFLHQLNELYTSFLLHLIDFPPFPAKTLYSGCPSIVVWVYLTLLFATALYIKDKRRGQMSLSFV